MLVTTASVAFRRQWPLGVGVVVLLSSSLLGLVASHGTSLAQGVSWMCGVYGVAVWTDSRGFLTGIGVLVAGNVISAFGPHANLNDIAIFTWVPALAMVLARSAVRGRQLQAETLAARASSTTSSPTTSA